MDYNGMVKECLFAIFSQPYDSHYCINCFLSSMLYISLVSHIPIKSLLCLFFHPSEFVEFLRAGPVPYSHSVGKLTYNYSLNHYHMSETSKYKSPSPDLLLEFQICVPSCLFYVSS